MHHPQWFTSPKVEAALEYIGGKIKIAPTSYKASLRGALTLPVYFSNAEWPDDNRRLICLPKCAAFPPVTATWIAAQVIQLSPAPFIVLQQINFGSIMGQTLCTSGCCEAKRILRVLRHIFVVYTLYKIYNRIAVGLILAACFFERCKPDGRLFTVSCFHVTIAMYGTTCRPFRISQLLKI